MSYDELKNISDTTSSLIESESSVSVFFTIEYLIDVSDRNEDDKSTLINVDPGPQQVDTVTGEELEVTRDESTVESFHRIDEEPNAHEQPNLLTILRNLKEWIYFRLCAITSISVSVK